jgi:hypothetical protein
LSDCLKEPVSRPLHVPAPAATSCGFRSVDFRRELAPQRVLFHYHQAMTGPPLLTQSCLSSNYRRPGQAKRRAGTHNHRLPCCKMSSRRVSA